MQDYVLYYFTQVYLCSILQCVICVLFRFFSQNIVRDVTHKNTSITRAGNTVGTYIFASRFKRETLESRTTKKYIMT